MSKKNKKFNITKNGYAPEEVDEYIQRIEDNFLHVSGEQKNRIFELKDQLTTAESKIKAFNKMSGRIAEAISEAVSKAEQIEKYSMQRLQFEIEQLKAFHERWQEYYERIMQRYPLDDDLAGVRRFNADMTRILSSPQRTTDEIKAAFTADYLAESRRLRGLEGTHSGGGSAAQKERAKAAKKPSDMPKAKKPPLSPQKKQGSIIVKAFEEAMSDENIDELLNKIITSDAIDEETAQAINAAATQFDPMQKINDYYTTDDYHNIDGGGGFSLAEALRPKQSLEDILKDLGVHGEE